MHGHQKEPANGCPKKTPKPHETKRRPDDEKSLVVASFLFRATETAHGP